VTAKLLQLLKWIFLPVTIALGISLYLVWLCVSSLGGILLIFGPIFLGLYLFKNGFGFLFGIGLIALLMWVTTHFENQLEKLSDLWERISEGILKFYGKLLPFSSNNGSMTVESHKRLKVRTSGEKRRRRPAANSHATQTTQTPNSPPVWQYWPADDLDNEDWARFPTKGNIERQETSNRPVDNADSPPFPESHGAPGTDFGVNNGQPEVQSRAAIPETQVVLLHKQMQKEIYRCLVQPSVPGRYVRLELAGIDILVDDLHVSTLIEIKTGVDVVSVIREAIGQLLEYSYFCSAYVKKPHKRLLIVSPLQITAGAQQYIAYIRATYGIEISYSQYVPGSYFFSLPQT
jgi:hypothetical protein